MYEAAEKNLRTFSPSSHLRNEHMPACNLQQVGFIQESRDYYTSLHGAEKILRMFSPSSQPRNEHMPDCNYSKSDSRGNRGAILHGAETILRTFSPSSQPQKRACLTAATASRVRARFTDPNTSPSAPSAKDLLAMHPKLPARAPIVMYRFNVGIAGLPLSPLFCPHRLQIHINSHLVTRHVLVSCGIAGLPPLCPLISLILPSNKYQLLAGASS